MPEPDDTARPAATTDADPLDALFIGAGVDGHPAPPTTDDGDER